MKRFFWVLICLLALVNCDDGDLIVDTIDFSEVDTDYCEDNNLIFKLKQSEALILNIPEETFVNEPTDPESPIRLDIDETNQVVYNFYNGTVTDASICSLIPPAIPTVNKQWYASSGVIEISTTAVKSLDETNQSTRITGYNHNIFLKNITFKKEDGTTQFYETFPFGDYLKTITPLPFNFNGLLQICTNNGQVYDFNPSGESFTLDIDSALIANEVTPIDKPRTGVVGEVKNKLVYRFFNSVLTPDYFCQTTPPKLPLVTEEWIGRNGGIIEVTTTTGGPPNSFKHTIVFKNVTLEKGNSNFQLGNSYKYGELQTIK